MESILYEAFKDKNYERCREILLTPEIDPSFNDNVLIRECPDLKMYEILAWHPAVDTCLFLNKKCCCEHYIQKDEYIFLKPLQIEVYEIILKRNLCKQEDDLKNMSLYDKLITYKLNNIISRCEYMRNIDYYIEWRKDNLY